ncbi:MAG: bifunctional 4-hydroxy-2-oxoglutarate aldolase/2-dehydro-3-deoxy-phosphogluconate aldolase [Phenylobacterium sp.]
MGGIDEVMRTSPVIPVLSVRDAGRARALAEALVAGGLKVLEVTLRTPAALEAIAEMRRVPGAIVGAGTVLNAQDLRACLDAGAQFIVSPGLTDPLTRAAIEARIPFLPGIATASDLMRGLDLGLDRFKFFPAEAAGGLKALAALAAPFAQCRFCPTGGISVSNAPAWLAHEAVLCVGGSWLAKDDVADADAVRAAARLRG